MTIVAIPIILGLAWYEERDVEALFAMPIWLVVMAVVMLRTPYYYYIEKDIIIVKFFLGRKVLEGICSIRPIASVDLKHCARSFGNGGLMGYTGCYRSKELGSFQMLAVNKHELALVTLHNGKKYVINYPRELLAETNCKSKLLNCT